MEVTLSVYEFVSLFLSTCALIVALIAYHEAGLVSSKREPAREKHAWREMEKREKKPLFERLRKRLATLGKKKTEKEKRDNKQEETLEKKEEQEKDMDDEIIQKIRDHEITPFEEE